MRLPSEGNRVGERLITAITWLIIILSGSVLIEMLLVHVLLLHSTFLSPAIQINTALCALLCAIAAWLKRVKTTSFLYYLADGFAIFVILIGVLTLYEYLTQINLGIDQFLLKDQATKLGIPPGRMVPLTAVNFVLLSCIILFFDSYYFKWIIRYLFPALVFFTSVCALFKATLQAPIHSYLEYLDAMEWLTATLLLMLSAQVIIIGWYKSASAVAINAKLIPYTLIGLVFLAAIVGDFIARGMDLGWYSPDFGMALLLAFFIFIFCLFVFKQIYLVMKEDQKLQQYQEKLQQNDELLRQCVENIEEVFWEASADMKKIHYLSPAFKSMWGRNKEDIYKKPELWIELVVLEDRERVRKVFLTDLQKAETTQISIDYKIYRGDGTIRHIFNRASKFKNRAGEVIKILGIASDLTSIEQSRFRLEAQQDVMRLLNQGYNINEICSRLLETICIRLGWEVGEIYLIDSEENILRCVDLWYRPEFDLSEFESKSRMLTYSEGVGMPGKIWAAEGPLWLPNFLEDETMPRAKEAHHAGLISAFGVPIVHKDIFYGTLGFLSRHTKEPDNELLKMMIIIGEQIGALIQQNLSEEQLKNMTDLDVLTGLLNRTTLVDSLDQIIKNKSPSLMLMLINIDGFKIINDAMGHDVGDILLQLIAARLNGFSPPFTKICGRIGADSFAVAIHGDRNLDRLKEFVEDIFKLFVQPFHVRGKELIVKISMGVSIYPQDGNDAINLLKNADRALTLAKQSGGNTFQMSQSSDDLIIREKLALSNQLHYAIQKKELRVFYQPIVNLKSGEINCLEALIRWAHPVKGLLIPDQFISIAEDTDFIINIGEWLMNEVCKMLASIEDPLPITINLSINQFKQQYDLVGYVRSVLDQHKIDPNLLQFEITENLMIINIERVLSVLRELKNLGAKILLDDFGVGFSSFNYLKQFLPDKIKIDKSFIADIPEVSNNSAIVIAMISIAHNLGLEVIAEGVEKAEQVKFLIQEKCDDIQGFYFSKALPENEMKTLLSLKSKLQFPPV